MADSTKVGLIGAGNIAPAYIKWSRIFEDIEVVACADLDMSKAAAIADEYDIRAMSVDELLAEDDIEIVVNLTIPAVHGQVSEQILNAGKHVYSEKPLGVRGEEGKRILDLAAEKSLRVGCAPDTFLGGGLQTCIKLIDDGAIGTPIGALAFMLSHGPESWHPNPDFFYKPGGGPMFDMGPYYITALVSMLGPIAEVSAKARASFDKRIATSEALMGHEIEVEVPTHYSGTLSFASGAIGTMVVSFDVWQANVPRIEIFGSEGTISVPDPNRFDGPVRIWTAEDKEWKDVPLTHAHEVGRSIGIADMAKAIRAGRPHRASGDLAYHALEVMESYGKSSDSGQAVKLSSAPERPAPLAPGLPAGQID